MAPSVDEEAHDLGGLVALRALAALLESHPSGAGGHHSSHTVAIAGDDALGLLGERLRRDGSGSILEALKAFESAGRRCLKELDKDTVEALRRCRIDSSAPTAAGSTEDEEELLMVEGVTEEEVAKIKLMFDHFDTDNTGVLGREQFKNALVELGLGEQLSDLEVDTLVSIADTNGDGKINLQEFTEWLYGGRGEREETPRSSREAADGEAEASKPDGALQKELADAKEQVKALEAKLRKTQRALADAEAARKAAVDKALGEAEEAYEIETEASFDFWRSVCNASAAPVLDTLVDLKSAELLGNGKYGFVFKSRRCKTDADVVMKLMGVRWAHVACKEWQQAKAVGGHGSIVRYEDAVLHSDADASLAELLRAGQDAGKLQGRGKRTKFPDRYICLLEEFMNRGTVQDWMDTEMLFPGGVLVVMSRVASALAFMHSKGITHNDIKPENVLLHQDKEDDPRAEVTVKLADLGLAKYSKDRTADFQQYGLTVHAMMTGERFGSRKFRPEMAAEFVSEVAELLSDVDSLVDEKISGALRVLPEVLRRIWAQETTMAELERHPRLQGWDFFDGEGVDEAGEEDTGEETKTLKRMTRVFVPDTVRSIGQLSARYSCEDFCPLLSDAE